VASEKRFKGVVRNVTLTREDMKRLLELPIEEIPDWSPVKVVLLPDSTAVCTAMARSMVDKVAENNRRGRPTSFILPVGPVAQYPIAADLSNSEGVSWANVWTFNMDEYLDWENREIPRDHPMSFHKAMKEGLFDRLDPKLTVPEAQRWFPDPFDPDAIDRKIGEIIKRRESALRMLD
jgi:glucosamine-6-phosphate deaminase